MKLVFTNLILSVTTTLILSTFLLIQIPFSLSAQPTSLENWELENIPEIPDRVVKRQNQFNNTRNARLLAWLPNDEGMLISTRFGEHYQIHSVDYPGGTRKQLTFFEQDGASNAYFRPNHNGFLIRVDASEGGEVYQYLYYDLDRRDYDLITDNTNNHLSAVWHPSGNFLAYSSPKKNSTVNQLFIYDVEKKEELYFPLGESAWYAQDWNQTDELLLVNQIDREFSVYIFNWKTNALSLVSINNRERIPLNSLLFDKEGTGIYFSSDGINGIMNLFHIDIKSNHLTNITRDLNIGIDNFWLSEDKNTLLFSTNQNGINPVFKIDTDSFVYSELKNFPEGLIYNLNFKDKNRIGFVLNNSKTPGDVYEYNLSNTALKRWTYSEVGGLNTDTFAEGKFFTYPTFDSLNDKPRQIPAFIYKPVPKKKPFPVLINIHGGPAFQHLPYFSANIQFMAAELGIAVISPNVRGSTGYGDEFLNLDNGFKREDAVKDIGKLLDWIEEQPDLDASRVAVYGGSYGGYMTLASMIHYNDRITCGIDLVGPSDWITFLENTRDSGRDRRRAEYGDERIPEVRDFLNEISPLTNAHKITKPLLVAQGLNDPRVPAAQSEMMVNRIRENGGDVWYMLAKDEGHNFRSRENINYFRQVLMVFLETYLLSEL